MTLNSLAQALFPVPRQSTQKVQVVILDFLHWIGKRCLPGSLRPYANLIRPQGRGRVKIKKTIGSVALLLELHIFF